MHAILSRLQFPDHPFHLLVECCHLSELWSYDLESSLSFCWPLEFSWCWCLGSYCCLSSSFPSWSQRAWYCWRCGLFCWSFYFCLFSSFEQFYWCYFLNYNWRSRLYYCYSCPTGSYYQSWWNYCWYREAVPKKFGWSQTLSAFLHGIFAPAISQTPRPASNLIFLLLLQGEPHYWKIRLARSSEMIILCDSIAELIS